VLPISITTPVATSLVVVFTFGKRKVKVQGKVSTVVVNWSINHQKLHAE